MILRYFLFSSLVVSSEEIDVQFMVMETAMFRFNCAHCGRPEILHYPLEDLKEYERCGLWPDDECQEDPPMKLEPVTLDEMLERAEGYQVTVLECPGFAYQDGDKDDVIETFVQIGTEQIWIKDFLPDPWRDEILRAIEAADDV